MSGDLVLMGDILREGNRLDEAHAKYAEAVKVIDQADLPQQVKDATHRNNVFEEGRLAVARGDLATARTTAAEYARLIAARKAPFEARQLRELRGSIALADKKGAEAVKELAGANQQDPKVLYLTALAFRESGDTRQAAAYAKKAARFNGLSFSYAYVRTKAASEIANP
jgi:tetratricopeptide (TPR) repeat protein